MDINISIDTQADKTVVRMNEVDSDWGCGSYLTRLPIDTKKAQRNHPLRLLFLVLWSAAELEAIYREKASQQQT